MASGPITWWQIDGETMETVTNFIFLGSKITTDGDCSHEIKRRLLLEREAMTILDSILKSRNTTLLTNVHIVKAMIFPVVMYRYESWTIKKAEHWRTDAFKSFPASGSFPVSQLFPSGGQSIGISALASILPMNIQGWFPLGLIGFISWLFNGLSWVFSSIIVWKHPFFGTRPSLWSNSLIYIWLLEKP